MVRPGYKQTEVGVIPEDWRPARLAQVCSMKSGIGITSESIDQFSEYPCYGGNGLRGLTTRFTHDGRYALIGRQGALCGNVVGVEGKFFASEHAIVVTASSRTDIRWLTFILDRMQLNNYSEASAQPGLSVPKLLYLKVAVPPTKAEQEAIAGALSDTDALTQSLEQLIAKKRQIKQGTMQELLRPNERWKPTTVGSIADPSQRWSFAGGPFGSNLKSSDYTDEGVRIIQLQNIGDGVFKDDYEIYTSPQKADELLSSNIYPGEIILSKMGDPVARACIIPSRRARYLMCSDGIRLAVDQSRFNTYFILTVINAQEFRTKAANAGTGSTRKRIGLTELRTLGLVCPSLPEQTSIAKVLSDIDSEIAALEEKLAKARKIKQGMMQELLTGRIRLI